MNSSDKQYYQEFCRCGELRCNCKCEVDRLKEIRENILSGIGGIDDNCPAEYLPQIQQASYNLGRDEVIEERIATYVSMRDKYAGVDDAMAYAYDTVVNDLLNMQLLKENKK